VNVQRKKDKFLLNMRIVVNERMIEAESEPWKRRKVCSRHIVVKLLVTSEEWIAFTVYSPQSVVLRTTHTHTHIEIDRILAKPEKKRTKIEKQFLDNALSAKKRKNEGDRNRRQRLKQMGVPAKLGLKGAIARGAHLRPMHPYPYPPPYGGPHMGEIPMSPMPPMGHHHHHLHHPHMQSPGGFGSPGMMPPMGYPSPQRRGPPGHPGVMETPGKSGGTPMPYLPPGQGYDGHGSPSSNVGGPGHTAEIRQRQNADGSVSIQIGSSEPTGGGEGNGEGGGPYNLNDLLGEESGETEGSK
jgi:hypothetical protein